MFTTSERADNGPRTRGLHHGEVVLFLLSYIRVEPPAGFAPAPSSLPRKRPDSGTARACAGRPGLEPGISGVKARRVCRIPLPPNREPSARLERAACRLQDGRSSW